MGWVNFADPLHKGALEWGGSTSLTLYTREPWASVHNIKNRPMIVTMGRFHCFTKPYPKGAFFVNGTVNGTDLRKHRRIA